MTLVLHDPGDDQLVVGERAALLVGDERRAVHAGRVAVVDRHPSRNTDSHIEPTICHGAAG